MSYPHWKLDYRLLFSLALAGITATALPATFDWATRTLFVWDTALLSFLASTWVVMLRATPNSMRRVARSQDERRSVILGLITTSACASLLAIFFMLRNTKMLLGELLSLHLALAGVTIVGGWLLVHTIFALHYAHIYYQYSDESWQPVNPETHSGINQDTHLVASQQAGGLDFPNDWEPDYWDFAYYSFVVGMTSQVSDIQTTSREMRRLTLLHGVLSFFFNTVIVAMSINILAGLI